MLLVRCGIATGQVWYCYWPGPKVTGSWPGVVLILAGCGIATGQVWYCYWPGVVLLLARCGIATGQVWYCYWPGVVMPLARAKGYRHPARCGIAINQSQRLKAAGKV